MPTNILIALKNIIENKDNNLSYMYPERIKPNKAKEQLNEYKGYKETNKVLEKQIEELKLSDSNRQKDFDDVTNKNKQYEDKIKNDKEMLDFYKNNNIELKDTLRELELSRKELEIEKLKISVEQLGKRNSSAKRTKKSE